MFFPKVYAKAVYVHHLFMRYDARCLFVSKSSLKDYFGAAKMASVRVPVVGTDFYWIGIFGTRSAFRCRM